jgi:alternate signal-mediated exported protein
MNKITKASIAAGAGVILLLGGGGTLAYWNDSATTDAGEITAGTLAIDSNLDGDWFETSDLVNPIDATTFLVVPGDSLTYIETFDVEATGDNLEATVAANAASITKGTWGDQLDVTVGVEDSLGAAISSITSANDGDTVTVTVTLDFAFDGDVTTVPDDVENDTQGEVVDLTALAITLTQIP